MGDCDDVLREVYPYLDGETEGELRVHIERHLHGCMDCLEVFDFEAELRQVIARKCKEEVPDSLRAKVLECLEGEQTSEPLPD
jgi:mycothiol system anti-sigma-R factor